MPPCLTLSNEKELHPPLHFDVVAIIKGALWSPSAAVANNFYSLLFPQSLVLSNSYQKRSQQPW